MSYPDYQNLYAGYDAEEIARLKWAYILGLISANCETVKTGIRPFVSINYAFSENYESLKTAMEKEINARGCSVCWEPTNQGTKRAMWQGYIWVSQTGNQQALAVIEFKKRWGTKTKSVEYHQKLGKLFGYSEEAINRYRENHKDG